MEAERQIKIFLNTFEEFDKEFRNECDHQTNKTGKLSSDKVTEQSTKSKKRFHHG